MTSKPPSSGTGRFTPALLLLFVGSGAAALIYEVVWFHVLRLVIGTSAISIAVLLGSFMGGMCLGSLLLPRFVSRSQHPLRVYAFLELGIGVIGIALPLLLPLVGSIYTSSGGSGFTGFMLRGIICAICLLPPTILMGATLPAIARWMEMTQTGIAKMGFFYGANIFGAVLGTVIAGFWLLRVSDIMVATYVAVGINVVVCGLALLLSSLQRFEPPAEEPVAEGEPIQKVPLVYVAIGISGLTALGAEVVWTRLLSLLLGASVYAFSLILAVFLIGLGIGSGLGSALARRLQNPRLALGMFQLGLAAAIVYGSVMITHVIPYFDPPWAADSIGMKFFADFLRCVLAMLPATILWGASFPIALAAAGVGARDPGRLVGGVYAANTVGAIVGSLSVGLILIGWQGTQWTQQAMAAVAGINAVALFVSVIRDWTRSAESERGHPFTLQTTALATVLLFGGGWAVYAMPAVPDGLIAYGRMVWEWDSQDTIEYTWRSEGTNASVAVSRSNPDVLNFHVSGKIVASTEDDDMRLQRLLGHLPGLLHDNPKSVLIVGCGAGVTAGCFVEYPSIERIVICEIEPQVPEGAKKYLWKENRRVIEDPRTEVILDDARHFLATTDEKFDIITSDPIHPWVRGAAALYSAEYYELVKERVNPGAIITQWVPLYQTNMESVKSQVGTFMAAFPGGTVWNSNLEDYGYDTVMMGQVGPMKINIDELNARLQQNRLVWNSLVEVGIESAVDLMMTYAGQDSTLTSWLKDAQINHDTSLRLQYLAGLALDLYEEQTIYDAMKRDRIYPEDLFVTTSPRIQNELREAFRR